MFCYLSLEIVPLKLSVDKKCTYTFSITIFKEVFINLLSTSKLLSFVEEHNALQWTFSVFFFFFSITFQGLQNSWSLKSAQYDGSKRWIQLFLSWHLDFHKTYDHQIWKACTSRRVDLLENYWAGTGDTITLISSDVKINLFSIKQKHSHQAWARWLQRCLN